MATELPDPADIGRHYDERSPIEDEFRNGQVHMHYWYDDDDSASLTEAVARISREVTDTLGLRAGEHVLDAGCGPGETAAYLARQFEVRITGVTVSAFEVEKANKRAEASGVGGLAQSAYGDLMKLDYPDDTFDAVLALESLQNARTWTRYSANCTGCCGRAAGCRSPTSASNRQVTRSGWPGSWRA
ncbi:SAM-dependent methyltransferase [Phytohabitans sp. LJ34]|uniref:SAM-dependent methyltransferase n=1 Tax=Phytohabitans sp. LJ34 TaxID=3452217 RepID=UPI003F8A72EA